MEPSESNRFARAVRGAPSTPPSRLRFVLAIALTLVLAACLTIALFLLGALFVRGARRGDWRALGAGAAVVALTVVMARGRARRAGRGSRR